MKFTKILMTKKALLTLVATAALFSTSAHANFHKPYLSVSAKIKNGSAAEFLPHSGPGKWDNYATMNLPVAPAESLVANIETKYKLKLHTRGEVHITVITPVEFWTLGKYLTMADINKEIEKVVQGSQFDILCLGRGQSEVDGKVEQVFFLVVRSNDLLNLREKIAALYLEKGGKPGEFKPLEYFPHITLGFTKPKRDLHLSDGVIKDFRSCVANTTVN